MRYRVQVGNCWVADTTRCRFALTPDERLAMVTEDFAQAVRLASQYDGMVVGQ